MIDRYLDQTDSVEKEFTRWIRRKKVLSHVQNECWTCAQKSPCLQLNHLIEDACHLQRPEYRVELETEIMLLRIR